MSYRCGVCKAASKPGEPERRRAIKRANGQIAREIKLCEQCDKTLVDNTTIEQLLRNQGRVNITPLNIFA